MLGDPCCPQAQGDRCDRRSVRPLHPAGRPRSHPVRQRTGVRRQGRAGMDRGCRWGSPWENGYIESFNARLRDELLNGEIFYTFCEAQIVIESWRNAPSTAAVMIAHNADRVPRARWLSALSMAAAMLRAAPWRGRWRAQRAS